MAEIPSICRGERGLAASSRRTRTLRLAGTILLGVLLTGFGCAKSGTRLEGTVTIDGNPVAEGRLQFVPQGPERRSPVTAAIKDGRYAASSVPLGTVRVLFSATQKTGRLIHEYSQPYEEIVSIIPKTYEQGMIIEVTADASTQDFALTSR
jgi:hypothetical protein